MPLLRHEFLGSFAVRHVASGELTEGDPISREVFHCSPLRPTVLIAAGPTKHGKSYLTSRYLSRCATKTYSLDQLVSRIATADFAHTEPQDLIQTHYDPEDLGKIFWIIDEREQADALARLICEGITPHDECAVIEGLITDKVRSALLNVLKDRAVVWVVERAGV
jgi:hypothetical protein